MKDDDFYKDGIPFEQWSGVTLEKAAKVISELRTDLSIQEDKLRNMANKLEEHMTTPDAHNPGILGKK